MIRRSLALAAFALAACLPLAACTEPDAAPTPVFDPKAALAASTTGIDAGGYTFSVTASESETRGAVHTPSGSAEVLSTYRQHGVNVTTRTRVTKNRTYRQWALSGDKWDELDQALERKQRSPDARVRKQAKAIREFRDFFNGTYWMPAEALPASATPKINLKDPDVIGVKRLLGRVATAQGDDFVITGTLDASHLTEDNTMIGALARQRPPRTATAMPFRATLDAQDHIATLSLTQPGSADSWVIGLGDYGTSQLTAPPADLVKKPSAAALTFLRGGDLSEPARGIHANGRAVKQ